MTACSSSNERLSLIHSLTMATTTGRHRETMVLAARFDMFSLGQKRTFLDVRFPSDSNHLAALGLAQRIWGLCQMSCWRTPCRPAGMRGLPLVNAAIQFDDAGGDSVSVRLISLSKGASNPIFVAFRLSECEVVLDSNEHATHLIIGQILWPNLHEICCRFGEALLYLPASHIRVRGLPDLAFRQRD